LAGLTLLRAAALAKQGSQGLQRLCALFAASGQQAAGQQEQQEASLVYGLHGVSSIAEALCHQSVQEDVENDVW
jgi:hypothetical protein